MRGVKKMDIILDKQDLTYLKWSHIRNSSGTAGTFLKSQSALGGRKIYYKLSNYEKDSGIVGHENINEIIVDRLLTVLGVEHLHYQLIYADIEIDGRTHTAYVCASEDFKDRGESKVALDALYKADRMAGETEYDFCKRLGFDEYIDRMLAVDYIILNRDRHGANIEVLRNARKHSLRIAPLFDHGLSLLFSCRTDEEFKSFDIMADIKCNNFIGSRSNAENLKLISGKNLFKNRLQASDREFIFNGLETVISKVHQDRIWEMITERYRRYENL